MSERVRATPAGGEARTRWPTVSDVTQRLIDSEVEDLVEEAEDLARAALSASRDALDRVAVALAEKETLTMDEVDELAGPPPVVSRRNGARAAGVSGPG